MGNKLMKRHTKAAIVMHWFNALCWLFLLATGLGLIKNPKLSPVGMWWPTQLQNLFGGGETLLYVHVVIGLIWAVGYLIFLVMNPQQHLIRFLKEILSISPKRDFTWLFKKMTSMTLGKKVLEKMGTDTSLPDQGFYNFGQKLFAIPATVGGVVIVLTGMVMILSKYTSINVALVQWSIFLHFLTVGLVFAGLLIHIFMAAIVTEERPAFFSMFSGMIPESFVKHHNKLWYLEQMAQKESIMN